MDTAINQHTRVEPKLHLGIYLALLMALLGPHSAAAQEQPVHFGATTTVEDSGLLQHLLSRYQAFRQESARTSAVTSNFSPTTADIHPVIMGSGQLLRTAQRGDLNLILVHSPAAEKHFIQQGYGRQRQLLMANHYLLIGPKEDPVNLRGSTNILTAFQQISQQHGLFVSRGDGSGTHNREEQLWLHSNSSKPPGYFSSGLGMGRTLQIAHQKPAHTLVDQGSWDAMHNRFPQLSVLGRDPDRLLNAYHLILVGTDNSTATDLYRWLLAPQGQSAIRQFSPPSKPLFIPADDLDSKLINNKLNNKHTGKTR